MPTRRPRPRPLPAPDEAAARPEAAEVLRHFRLVFTAVRTHFREVEKKTGVGGAQVWALSVIQAHPDIGVGALARLMDIHQSTTSNLVKLLIERGMVAALRKGVDKRAVQLRILPAGAKLLRRAPRPFEGVLPEALASLDRTTLRRLKKDLAGLVQALGVDPADKQTPLAQL
jgi:DNA-binding MarR family transcriptional regulator